jgi:hypothetical protein
MPVVRSIWRDILGFIPAYSVAFFVSLWAGLMILQHRDTEPFFLQGWQIGIATGLVLACAVADWIEDALHLRYVAAFPQAPPARTVVLARTATCIKFGLGAAGLLAMLAVTAGLVLVEIRNQFLFFGTMLFRPGPHAGAQPASALGACMLGLTIVLGIGAVKQTLRGRNKLKSQSAGAAGA